MKLVIVESPAKAKAIGKYLGSNYTVLASYGHIRDLPSKNGSVKPDDDFSMVWEIQENAERNLKKIYDALKQADTLYLATDADREGEAIAWHLCEIFKEKKLLKNVKIYRSVFHEITKKAVTEAIDNPRELNQELIHAYLARRALDYLVGFTLSPVLWHKLPGSKSAGRVQSVALRLITDRQNEVEKFKSDEYWTIDTNFIAEKTKKFSSRLTKIYNEKVHKFYLFNEESAHNAVTEIKKRDFSIKTITHKKVQRSPQPPFITSTLQQEGARKLGFSAKKTMQIAQQLYEGIDIGGEITGLITYMRTDSIHLGNDAIQNFRTYISETMDKDYLPAQARAYKSNAKNAQEAHEGIRPTDITKDPVTLKKILNHDQGRLYELIWKRALASQMSNAIMDQVVIDVVSTDEMVAMRTTGSTIAFDGFLKLYQESKDAKENGEEDEDKESLLPNLIEGSSLDLKEVLPVQHFTQPPPRFTEASLVKKLEELGIGRPSTYASIISVLQSRNYVRLGNKQFFPEDRGRLVSVFLENYFKQYVEYDFTANLENELDHISNGELDWKTTLRKFWNPFKTTVQGTEKLKISEVLDVLDRELSDSIFPHHDGHVVKECPNCKEGKLHLKIGKFGAFIGCEHYPECKYTHKLGWSENDEEDELSPDEKMEEYPKTLGIDSVQNATITLRKGPYGFYVQQDNTPPAKKPRRASLPKDITHAQITLDKAIELLSLPREVGLHPDTKEMILANFGRYGPYLKYQDHFVSVKNDDILTVSLEKSLELINADLEKKAQALASGAPIGKRKFGSFKKKEPGKSKSSKTKK